MPYTNHKREMTPWKYVHARVFTCESVTLGTSLVPRPRPVFCRFQYGKAGEGLVSFLTRI